MIDALILLGGLAFGVVAMEWIWRRSRRLSILWAAIAGGLLFVGWAVEEPSARTIAMAVWWIALFSLLLLPVTRQNTGPMGASIRNKWQRWLLYFAVGLSVFGLAIAMLSSETVALWAIGSALLFLSILWIAVYGWRLSFYGRMSRLEHTGGGSALP